MKVTPVVFRRWADGSIIALFPTVDDGGGMCRSYETVGQHAGADYAGVVQETTPATDLQAAPLYRELKRVGYKLRVCQRRPPRRR